MFRQGLILFAAAGLISGCTRPAPPVDPRPTMVVEENKVPGTVDHFWVEPMHDTVQVPAQIDPKDTYYRPAHQTVIEVRPERFEKVKYDGEKKDEQNK